jgi:hypothetical protein
MPRKSEPKQKIEARSKRRAGIKEMQRKRKARVNQVLAVKKTLEMNATGIAWGIAKRAAKPLRKAARKADGMAIKAVKGLFSFRG